MRVEVAAALLGLAISCTAAAQLVPTNPDWRETEVAAPGPVKTTGLIPVDVPGSELRWGVDPNSIVVGQDGIVRYVVVAASGSGAVNAFHEGLRCTHQDVKVYARNAGGSGWTPVANAEWQPIASRSSRHTLEIAKAGACQDRAPNSPASRIARQLSSGKSSLYDSR